MRPARGGCMLARMLCAQYVILGACVVGAVIVSLCAAWGAVLGTWVRLRIERAAKARAAEIERAALALQERATARARRLVLTAAKVATRWPGPGS
jgi:hypothetical protein